MPSVFEIAKKLNREFKNETLAIKADIQPKYCRYSMDDLGFDYPLFGGLPEGRVVQFSGKESSGKTTAACAFAASYQRKRPDKTCVFIDVEHALDLTWIAQATGLDLTKTVYVSPDGMSGEQILDLTLEFLQAEDIGIIILDSVAALVTGQVYEEDVTKESFANISKSLGRFFGKCLDRLASSKAILLIINQLRPDIGARVPSMHEPCGKALAYYTSVLLRFGTRTFTHKDKVDSREDEHADGIRLWFSIRKNKTATTERGGGFITIRYAAGVDWLYDLLEVALTCGFIRRPTIQRYQLVDLLKDEIYTDKETGELLEFVGKDKVKAYFAEHLDFQNEYVKMLNTFISLKTNAYGSLLDERRLAEMDEENARLDKESGII